MVNKVNAIELINVRKVFRLESDFAKECVALDDVTLSFPEKSLTVVAGSNGSGKSVMMKIIAGLVKQTSGEVKVLSKPGLVFQDADSQILGDTPKEDVAVGPKNQKVPKSEIAPIVEKNLKTVGLLEKADFPAEFLSGGEKRRLSVASILAMNRDIIIFDEPYANLDYPGVKSVNALISELKADGKTIIILTHEIEKCLALSDKLVILSNGRVVFDGESEKIGNLETEKWGIKNPFTKYTSLCDLVW